MTVAAKEAMPQPQRRVKPRGASGNPWRRLWQVPLLLLGATAFGVGIKSLVATIKPVPFETQAKSIQSIMDAGRYQSAIDEINRLAPYYMQPLQQAELQMLTGDTHYLALRKAADRAEISGPACNRIIDHYQKAAALGIVPSVEMNERWGEAAMGSGDAKVAMEKLEAAITAAPEEGPHNRTSLITRHGKDLVAAYLDAGQSAKASAMVDLLIAAAGPPEDLSAIEERTWGICKQIEIALAGDAPKSAAAGQTNLDQAIASGRQALQELKEHDPQGRVLVWIGRAEWERGDAVGAERDLKEARKYFVVHHMDDGRAAVLLGKAAQRKGEYPAATALFAEVITAHAGETIWPAARLGRAEINVYKGMVSSDEVMGDFQSAIAAVKNQDVPVGKRAEMITREEVQGGLLEAYRKAFDTDQLECALTLLSMEQQIEDVMTAEAVYRFALTKERRAKEILAEGDKLEGPARAGKEVAGRAMLADAAADYLKHSRMTTLDDDQSGASLWKAGGLLDAAGQTMAAVEVYKRFTIQRPADPRVPEGMLNLGRLYQSAGMIKEAIQAYEQNIRLNPKTPGGYMSVVNLARCYAVLAGKIAAPEDPEKKADIDKSAALLQNLVESADLQPTAREFRDALLALGDLYFDNHMWAPAIQRFDEVVTRYPSDTAVPRALFLLGMSYRNSAADIADALGKDAGIARRDELAKARLERLQLAAGEFSSVIAKLDLEAASDSSVLTTRLLAPIEEQYLRTSYMNRAACAFDRGEYDLAIKLYDETSARFTDEVIGVQSFVQIVNAYLAMNQPIQAKAAAERGRWLLSRVPDSAFAGTPGLSRDYFKTLLEVK
ncbi:MAG TPA: tetratricopeptide repeat protein [Phycisphaerae bacterium]|jgi:tetratricopeptide (TPR) repeat protein